MKTNGSSSQLELERYAEKARAVMTKVDALPQDIRALVYEYGANKVLSVYHPGDTAKRVLEDMNA